MRAVLDAHRHTVLATPTPDGAPRVSGIEAAFAVGELWLAGMPRSVTSRDLRRAHGSSGHGWQAWLSTSVTVLVVYLVIALATWELHYFWPVWVIGPWGAALLAQSVAGRSAHAWDQACR